MNYPVFKSYRPEVIRYLSHQNLKLIDFDKPVAEDWFNSPYSEYDTAMMRVQGHWVGMIKLTLSFKNGHITFYKVFFRIVTYEYNGYQETVWIRIQSRPFKKNEFDMRFVSASKE